ncbi:hypothetical protein OG900_21165 [Streptomyces sp. NBC_00433]
MRKLQQLAVVAMAVGGLSAISAGVSFADAPAAPPQGQSQAPEGTEISPQVSPSVTLPQAPPLGSVLQAPQTAPEVQNNLFRPYQECSPQTVLQANLPIAVLGGESKTAGDTCTQINNAFED